MGRPLNKKYFGNPAQPGKQVVLTAFIPGEVGPVEAHIVRQVGTGRFQVVAADNATKVGVVRLVDNLDALVAGEAHLVVKPFGKANEYARTIHNRSVRTWEGNIYKWSLEAAAVAGEADLLPVDDVIEEAPVTIMAAPVVEEPAVEEPTDPEADAAE